MALPRHQLRELALFAGAGGGLLASRILGWRTVCAVELDRYARSVLFARQRDGQLERFPIWDDVTTFEPGPWRRHVDIVTGGFPCQDISVAGSGVGIDLGVRSGLWREMARVVREVRPSYVFLENSPALTSRGLGRVLGDLAQSGYDARWDCIPAAAIGAPHRRDRIFVAAWAVSDADRDGLREQSERGPGRAQEADRGHAEPQHVGALAELGDAAREREQARHPPHAPARASGAGTGEPSAFDVADTDSERCEAPGPDDAGQRVAAERRLVELADTDRARRSGPEQWQERSGQRAPGADGDPELADADSGRREELGEQGEPWQPGQRSERGHEPDRCDLPKWPPAPDDVHAWGTVQAEAQPAFCGVATRMADRVGQIRALGNGQVPAVVVLAWQRLMEGIV